MQNLADLFLGSFIILCGFLLSMINFHRLMKTKGGGFSTVLLSENLLLTCIGIAFVSRSVYKFHPMNIVMSEIEERSAEIEDYVNHQGSMKCNFMSVLMSYGPLIVSLVNSFVTLIINNYMQYRVIEDDNKKEEANIVQEIGQRSHEPVKEGNFSYFIYFKKYFPLIGAILQWIIPIFMAVLMYPIEVKEKTIRSADLRHLGMSCMTMLDAANETCLLTNLNQTLELRNYLFAENNSNVFTNEANMTVNNKSASIKAVVDKIYDVVNSFGKELNFSDINVSSQILARKSKIVNINCLKMCYLDTKSLLLYLFLLSAVCYFLPITVSMVLLTKIHMYKVVKSNMKTFVSRELLYNTLFWTPVMFDTFLSLIFCTYIMNGTRTSVFHVIANVYQVVSNFINTTHFKDNSVSPV